jgi:UDP:flavonoid glycosyltransferase YjiC (YdhE family)
MDALPKVDRRALRESLLADFNQMLEQVADAIDDAKAGRVIRDSEEPARQALDELRRKVYQQAVQMKVDAAEAAFSPSDQSDQSASSAE